MNTVNNAANKLKNVSWSKIIKLTNPLKKSVVYWLVQLASLTMVAVLNVRWQGSKIRQCRLESRDTICESMGECTQTHN